MARLEHQPVQRDVREEVDQVPAAALVADPSRDADVPATVEVREELGSLPREAVHDCSLDLPLEPLQDRNEVLVGAALVKEHGLLEVGRNLELALEGRSLSWARGEVPEVVEPRLPDRDHVFVLQELAEEGVAGVVEFAGVVRVDASRREQAPRASSGEF